MVELNIKNFDIEKICYSGQCFRMNKEEDGCFSVIAGSRYLKIQDVDGSYHFECSKQSFEDFWKHYFDLDRDYDQIATRISKEDSYLLEAAAYGYGIRILNQDLWEMILSFLISQNNNITRIRKCIDLVCRRYGKEEKTEDGQIYYGIPHPEILAELSDEDLKACNLGYRSKYIIRTSKMIQTGGINLDDIKKMDYAHAKQELLKCYGIGEKVADCICLFGLHHLNAFPVDTHIKKVLDLHYKAGFPMQRYEDICGVLQQYIFYYDVHPLNI